MDAAQHRAAGRIGYGKKTIISDYGECEIAVPRDRNGDFEPKVIEKRQTRTDEIEQKIMQMYAKGKCQRDTLTISNSTGSNERTHRSEFDTLRYVQCIPARHRRYVKADLQNRNFTRSGFADNRQNSAEGQRVAEPSAGGSLPGSFLRWDRVQFAQG